MSAISSCDDQRERMGERRTQDDEPTGSGLTVASYQMEKVAWTKMKCRG